MTIKELENRTGMTRANIRFYEGEGLLSPKRLENGYRDYSKEDVRTLEKIKLLRQLQMDLDTIRLVQKGVLTLEQALFSQLTRLEGDKTVIERAAQVCRELEQSGVEYGALEPEPWLDQLKLPPQPAFQPPPQPSPPLRQEPHYDVPRACYYPWRRLFARGLDVMLYSTAFELAWLLISWDQSILNAPIFVNWVLTTLALVFALAVEPLWIHFLGWTPGKWVFGLKLRDRDGNRLTLAQGWRRSKGVGWEGYAWNIPIAGLVIMWKCRKRGLDGMDCAWDADEGYRYTREERRVNPMVVYLVAAGMCTGLTVLATLQTNMPVNRGDLTVAEFSENYDQYHRRLMEPVYEDYVPRVDREGRWERSEHSGTQIGYTTTDTTLNVDSGKAYQFERMVTDTEAWDQMVFTVEEGRVTAVTLRMTVQDSVVWPGGISQYRETLALLAISGAVDGLNPFNYNVAFWAAGPGGDRPAWEDWEADFRGLHICQRVVYSGYVREDFCGIQLLVCPDEDTPCRCENTVTISLIE